jgi:hypothetical protein
MLRSCVQIMLVSGNCPTLEEDEGQVKIVNVQFNSLDVIANQETIIELIGFHRRVFPEQQRQAFQPAFSQDNLLEAPDSDGPPIIQPEVRVD